MSDRHRDRRAAPARPEPDWQRIAWLLDRLDPRAGEPGAVPGEIILDGGRETLAEAA